MKSNFYKYFKIGLLIFVSIVFLSSCKKFVQVPPPVTSLTNASVFTNDASAKAAVNGIYEQIMQTSNGFASGNNSIAWITGLTSDELLNNSTTVEQKELVENRILPTNYFMSLTWNQLYKHIYSANAVIEGLNSSSGVEEPVKKQLLGEAYFLRGWFYFNLINFYGPVPLVLSTDYTVNVSVPRESASIIYENIIADLVAAKDKLIMDYAFFGGEKIRPNKWAASALLAKVYLYLKQWDKSVIEANEVIDDAAQYSLPGTLDSVFLKNNAEAIWQLQPIITQYGVYDAQYFIITSTPRRVSLSAELLNKFESGDMRRSSWIGVRNSGGTDYFYPFKYKERFTASPETPPSEYLNVLRLAEVYLIRSEARAELGDFEGSASDLNQIRIRAGLDETPANDKTSLLEAVEQERRVELFTEWGNRWFDLKRWNKADALLSAIKSPNWQATDTLYPIPQAERNKNSKLSQNLGY